MHDIQESGEMYLETILILTKKKTNVRSIDVANHMNYSKPSISRGIGILRDRGYVIVDEDGFIHLTESGLALAEKIYERHRILTIFFKSIGISDDTASNDACRIEHVISDETFSAIKKLMEDK